LLIRIGARGEQTPDFGGIPLQDGILKRCAGIRIDDSNMRPATSDPNKRHD
jgi:hypothetical protein